MKKTAKWIITALVLVIIIAGASVLYNNLSPAYSDNNLNVPETTTATVQNTSSYYNEPENTATQSSLMQAPDFTVFDENGNEVRLSDFRGKPVVLNFWATWCYYCKVEMPDFNIAYSKYPDVQFLMVNATDGIRETVENAKKYVTDEGYDFDIFFDTEYNAVMTYGINSYPITFFIDKNGNLVANKSGMLDLPTLEKGISMITE